MVQANVWPVEHSCFPVSPVTACEGVWILGLRRPLPAPPQRSASCLHDLHVPSWLRGPISSWNTVTTAQAVLDLKRRSIPSTRCRPPSLAWHPRPRAGLPRDRSPFPASKLGNSQLPAAHPRVTGSGLPSPCHPTDCAADATLIALCAACPRRQLSYTLSAVCSSSRWCQGG